MNDDELVRDFLEKIVELFGRPTEPIILRVAKTSEPVQLGDEAAITTATETQTRLIMKMHEVFPSKYLRAAALRDGPRIETIDRVSHDAFKDDGVSVTKTVLHFRGNGGSTIPPLILNKTNWRSLIEITHSDDDDDWPGHRIELRSEKVLAPGGNIVDGIRVHAPAVNQKPRKAAAPDLEIDLESENPAPSAYR
jgi:hypothetical protein